MQTLLRQPITLSRRVYTLEDFQGDLRRLGCPETSHVLALRLAQALILFPLQPHVLSNAARSVRVP